MNKILIDADTSHSLIQMNTKSLYLPLNKLFLSTNNVRKVEPTNIPELAQMIAVQGLLHPLHVTLNPNADHGVGLYGVEAGGRRFRALQLLRDKGLIFDDHPIECRLIDHRQALEVSLTENTSQESMHPADEFEAYAALVDMGQSVAAVANKFGVTEVHVQRRLKMAKVAPELMDLYRGKSMTLDQLMALAATDDHERQVQVWGSLASYNRNPRNIKARMFEDEVSMADKRLKIVSLDAYITAGGSIRHDLFSDESTSFVTDPALLDRLVEDHINNNKAELLADGWSWVETIDGPVYEHSLRSKFTFPKASRRSPTPDEAKAICDLEALIADLEMKEEAADEADDERASSQYACEIEKAQADLEQLQEALIEFAAFDKSACGVIIGNDNDGLTFHFGVQRASVAASAGKELDATGQGIAQRASVPEKLALNLTSHLTSALQATMLTKPDVALALLASKFAQSMFASYQFHSSPLGVRIELQQSSLEKNSDSITCQRSYTIMQDRLIDWKNRLPTDAATWFDWFANQPQSVSIEMIVFGTSMSTTAVTGDVAKDIPASPLIKATGLDMADWWEPTPSTYMELIPKAKMMEAVADVDGQQASESMGKMKKAEAVAYATSKLAGKRWLPKCLQF